MAIEQPLTSLVDAPNFTGYIDQTFFLEPTGGPAHPYSYLDRFPETVYNLGPFSHLVRFLYTLLGPAGVGSLKKNLLTARLTLEERNIDLFDIDRLYGDPFKFGRVLDEIYTDDVSDLLTREQWDDITAKDSSYRSRALDFMGAARAGTTPLGARLAARSGLNHEVEIVENYKYLFDQHTDKQLGFNKYGSTMSTEEFVIIPRQELSRSAVQIIQLIGPPIDGFFTLDYNGEVTQPIAYNVTSLSLQHFLEALPSIGTGSVYVYAGVQPYSFFVQFQGSLAGQPVPTFRAHNYLVSATDTNDIDITVATGGVESVDEAVNIAPKDQKHLQEALDRIKAVTSIPTLNAGRGRTSRVAWNLIQASSEFREVIKYVTPPVSYASDWLQANTERQVPVPQNAYQHHYVGIHDIANIYAYSDEAVKDPNAYGAQWGSIRTVYASNHIGPFNPFQTAMFPFMKYFATTENVFLSANAIFEDPQDLGIQGDWTDGTLTFGGIPITYYNNFLVDLNGGTPLYRFWASRERTSGDEFLEIDLGSRKQFNFISLETTRKPLQIVIEFDTSDHYPFLLWWPVTPLNLPTTTASPQTFTAALPRPEYPYQDRVTYSSDSQNPWDYHEFNFCNALGQMVTSRYVRIRFIRDTTNSPFIDTDGSLVPWSVDVRGLKIGRNISE